MSAAAEVSVPSMPLSSKRYTARQAWAYQSRYREVPLSKICPQSLQSIEGNTCPVCGRQDLVIHAPESYRYAQVLTHTRLEKDEPTRGR